MSGTAGGQRSGEVLPASEGLFRALFEQSPLSVQVLAPTGETVAVNRAWEDLWGVTLADLPGYNLLEDPQLATNGVLPLLRRAIAGERTAIPPAAYVPDRGTNAGRVRWVRALASPVRDEAGFIARVVLVQEDVTDLVAAQEDLARLAAIVGGSEDAIIARTLAGTVTDWNPGAERLYGYAAAEAIGRDIGFLVPPDRTDELAALSARLRRGERVPAFETVRVRRDGRRVDVAISLSPVRDAAGRVVGAATIARDVTERRRAEEALGRSRDELAAVLQGITDGVVVQDPRGRLVYANEAAARLLGAPSAEALLASSPVELLRGFTLFDEAGRPFPPADLPGFHALAGERPPRVTVRWRRLGTGEDRWSVVGAEPVLDGAGRVRLAVNTFQDVTERKRAEAAQRFLAEAGALLAGSLDYETTLVSVADLAVRGLADWCAVDVRDEDGTVRRLAVAHVDPAKVALARELGERYPTDPDAPAGLAAVLRSGTPELYGEITDAMLAAGARDAEHLAILRGVGMTSAMIVPLVARGRTLGAITLVAAESGRRYGSGDLALAEELARRAALAVDNARLYGTARDALRDRDEFLSAAAHELRTPAASVKGIAQLLLRSRADPERLAWVLRRVDEAASRLTRLVDDLMLVARDRLGRLPLRPRPIDLAALARDAVDRVAAGEGGGRRPVLAGADAPRPLVADPDRLEQVLANLLDNAVKYSPDGGEIRVELGATEGGVRLTVADRGIGLPAGAAETIFAPFARTAAAAERGVPGVGLGLFISRGLVERHGGRIWAESAGEGRGTAVHVWLPAAPLEEDYRAPES